MSNSTPTRPDLLQRFDRLGLDAKTFEMESGLGASTISQMRAGRYGSEKGKAKVALFEAAIRMKEHQQAATGPIAPPAPTSARDDDPRVEALALALKAAATLGDLDAALKTIHELTALGIIVERRATALEGLCHQRRMNLVELEKQRRVMDSSKPVEIVVRWCDESNKKIERNRKAFET